MSVPLLVVSCCVKVTPMRLYTEKKWFRPERTCRKETDTVFLRKQTCSPYKLDRALVCLFFRYKLNENSY